MPKVTKEKPLTAVTQEGDVLDVKEEMFCRAYVETFGNGTQAAHKAYDCKNDNTAAVMANEYLRKPKIITRISELLEDLVFNDATVDTRLAFNAFQYENLQASNKAIEMYNKLKGRYEAHNQQQSNVTITWKKNKK